MGMDMTRREALRGAAGVAAGMAAGSIMGAGTALADWEEPTPTWLGEAPAISDADCAKVIDVDVLVCGAGTAGFFAACSAAEEGAKTLLIEKLPASVGIRGMLSSVGNKLHKKYGVEIDKNDIANDLCRYTLNYGDLRVIKLWTEKSGEAVDWYIDLLEKNGIFIDLEWNMPEEETRYKAWPASIYTTEDDAAAITAAITAQLEQAGGELMCETALVCLIKEGGRVVGAYATGENDDYIRINASKGVILATGGYGKNAEMLRALQPDLCKGLAGSITFPSVTGDGIKAALWAGAQFNPIKTSMVFDRALLRPEDAPGDHTAGLSSYHRITSQPWLRTDVHGERFMNESAPYDFTIHAASHLEGRVFYSFWDANWRENIERFHTTSCSTIPEREGGFKGYPAEKQGIDMVAKDIDARVENGYIIKADTIEELAAGLGIDPDGLVATVARYNELFDKQDDEDFGKEAFRLSELRTPPFYGVKAAGTILCTLDGICVNTEMQALDEENRPIEGLYCVGNDGGCYHAFTYGNLVSGNNAGRCATFGRLAGKIAAKS